MAEQIQNAEQPQPGGLPPQRGQVGQVNDQQPQPPELLVRMDTNQLKRWRDQLLMHIPSDPTWGAAVASVLREILSSQIAHPDRRERDKADDEARKRAAASKAEADLKAKQDAELAGLPPEQRAAVEARHKAEQDKLAADKARIDLAAKQLDERKEFEQYQAKKRDALTAPVRPVGGDTQGMQPSPPARSAPTPGW